MTGHTVRSIFRITLLVLLLVLLVGGPASTVDARLPASDRPWIPAASTLEQSVARSGTQLQASDLDTLDIPQVQASPVVDASCSEYGSAVAVTFMDGNDKLGTVFAMYFQGILYVCMQAQPGTFADRFARLYLDPQADGSSYTFANQTDYALQVDIQEGSRSSYHGTGVPDGWTLDPSLDDLWNGAAASNETADIAEWEVNAGRFFIDPCSLFGMAVYHHWFARVDNDYGMPSNQWFDQPHTWQLSRLYSPACYDLPGRIAYVFRHDLPSAVSFYNLMVGAG